MLYLFFLGMRVAKLRTGGLETILEYNGKTERLSVSNYPEVNGMEEIFSQFCAFHLVAPHLPRSIVSEFHLARPVIRLIDKLYASEGEPAPYVVCPTTKAKEINFKTSASRAVISYSAGKDSLWNLWWAQEKYGKDNVLAVHISGLNRSNASDETKYAIRQSKKLGFRLEVPILHNGYAGKGHKVMRSRDMFMVGLLLPYALKFGASNIIIEGFGEVADDELFTGQEHNMISFNGMLSKLGINVKVGWKNRKEMDVVKDLYVNKPDWISEVCNCFSPSNYKLFLHNSWKKRAPSIQLYDSQCGSCVKCRIINIGRILYDQNLMATEKDILYYIKSTEKWYLEHLSTHDDMICGSFLDSLKKAAKEHDVYLSRI
jgi:7-cyano-7-deazaguanine synthase in queuosine biosynthesis